MTHDGNTNPDIYEAVKNTALLITGSLNGAHIRLEGQWPPEFVELLQWCTHASERINALVANELILRQKVADLEDWIAGPAARDKRLRN
jgi:hypothetical protein